MSEPTYSIPLQATIGGLAPGGSSGAEALFGELDLASGVLLVDDAETIPSGVREVRRDGCAAVSNNADAPDADEVFTEEHLREAIAAYYVFAGRGLLVLDDSIQRHNPASKIEPDGMDEHGRKYRIAPDIGNGQLAIIVMCWFASRQAGFTSQLAAIEEDVETNVLTVGIPEWAGQDRRIAGYAAGGTLPVGRDGWPA